MFILYTTPALIFRFYKKNFIEKTTNITYFLLIILLLGNIFFSKSNNECRPFVVYKLHISLFMQYLKLGMERTANVFDFQHSAMNPKLNVRKSCHPR